jgi:PAS domain S-box-containing protein
MAEPAAPDSLAQVTAIIDLSPVPMVVFDVETLAIVLANAAAAELYGWSAEELQSMSMLDLRPAGDVPKFLEMLRDVIRPMGTELIDQETAGMWRHARKDGSVMLVHVVSSAVVIDGRVLRIMYVRDETARVRAEKERDRSIHRLLDVQEHLHNAIAERLHDGPVQTLTAASLRIGLLRRTVDASLEPKLAEIERLVIDALHSLRREMDDQRAPLDIASDFAGSIRSVLTRFGLQDHYVVRSVGGEPPASIASLLYRVVMSVLSTTSLGSDVDDPWIIDLEVTPTEASVRIPVAPSSELEAQLADWTGAMGGVVEREVHDGFDHLRMVIRIPPTTNEVEAGDAARPQQGAEGRA